MSSVNQLDKKPAIQPPACPDCKGTKVTMLRHWNSAPRQGFDPDYVCESCGFKWIHRRLGEKIRSFIDQ